MKSIKEISFIILVFVILPIGCEKKPTAEAFHKAVQTGDIDQVRVLISKGAVVILAGHRYT